MSTASTLRADQQLCQNGLLEGHSGGYWIEPLRPLGVIVCNRPGEVRSREVCSEEVRLTEVCPGEVRPFQVCLTEIIPFGSPSTKHPGEVRLFQVRPRKVRESHAIGFESIVRKDVRIRRTRSSCPPVDAPGEVRLGSDMGFLSSNLGFP